MDDDRRREANKRNAQNSTGPRTAAGKERSSRNATRHGLLSQRMLLGDESEEELRALRQGMRQSLRPVGELEEELVERMVAATWRKRRGDRVELGLWDWRGHVSSGKSTLANVFFMDSQHDQSLQKLTRYMSAYSAEFRRAFQMLREAQDARRDEAAGTGWLDVESCQSETEADGRGNEEVDDPDEADDVDASDDEEGPDDDPTGGSSAPPDSTPGPVGQATEFSRGPDWKTRAECSTAEPKVDPRAPRHEARRGSSSPSRWQALSAEERILFAVRNQGRVLAVTDIIDEVLFDRSFIERMSVSGLIRTSSAMHDMIWQTTLGIDKLIEQEDRRVARKGH